MNILVIFRIQWVSISLTERNNCNFPARLKEFFRNSGSKGLNPNFSNKQADKLVSVHTQSTRLSWNELLISPKFKKIPATTNLFWIPYITRITLRASPECFKFKKGSRSIYVD